jgi:predicted small metal-binding protein
MKEMRCADLMKGCNFVARGATDDEVMKKAAEHAKAAHGMKEVSPELAKKVKAAIRNA